MLAINKFDKNVREKGKDYYNTKPIQSITINNIYYAKINGYTTVIGKNIHSCNCPYNGLCKHLYALLLLTKNKKNDSTDIIEILKKKSNTELITIITDIMKKHPEYSAQFLKKADINNFKNKSYYEQLKNIDDQVQNVIDYEPEYAEDYETSETFGLIYEDLQYYVNELLKKLVENNLNNENELKSIILNYIDMVKTYGADDAFDDLIKYLK